MGNVLKPCKQQHPSFDYEPLINPPVSEEAENENLRVFSVKELKRATNKLRTDRVVNGFDGSVRTFYKGKGYTTFAPWKSESRIAVSVMECLQNSSQAVQAWKEEVESLGKLSHPNLVKLFGYSCEDSRSLLVYEYMHKGSLDHHIFGKEEALPWETRVKIAIGIAQALAFLHSIKNIPIHRQLRMHNIMLDEQYNAKLFFLESPQRYLVEERIYRGEAIYAPPEYLTSGWTGLENDVYTFGVILFELLTASKERANKLYKQSLDGWTTPFLIGEIIDPRLGNGYPVKAAIQMGTLIQSCTNCDKKKRPVMQQVLQVLNNIAEIEY